jgi:hypothetical protein
MEPEGSSVYEAQVQGLVFWRWNQGKSQETSARIVGIEPTTAPCNCMVQTFGECVGRCWIKYRCAGMQDCVGLKLPITKQLARPLPLPLHFLCF